MADAGRCTAERIEHLFLRGGSHLLLRQNFPRLTIDCFQTEHVFTAKAGYGASDIGLATGAETDFARYCRSDRGICGPSHQLQGGGDLIVREDVEKWRLAQTHAKRLL